MQKSSDKNYKKIKEKLLYQAYLLDQVYDAVIATDMDFSITYWNKAAERTYGWTADEVLGQNADELFQTVFTDDNREEAICRLMKNESVEIEVIHKRKDSSIINVITKVSLICIDNSQPLGTVGVLRDITERKMVEEQLLFHSSIAEYAIAAIFATDAAQNVLFWNKGAETLYGWRREEAIGRNLAQLFTPIHYEGEVSREQAVRDYIEKGWWRGEARYLRKDGSIIDVMANGCVLKDQNGKVTTMLIIHNDITELKQAEESLAFQACLLSSVHDAIIAADENYVITYWNSMAEDIFGWKAHEAIGKPTADILKRMVPGFSSKKAINKIMEGDFYEGELIYHHKDGQEIFTHVHASVIRDNKGSFKGAIASFRDITERKKAEEDLKESEKRFRSVQENSRDRFTILKPFYNDVGEIIDFTYVFQNAQAAKTSGRRPEELVGLRMTDVWPTFLETRFFSTYKEVAETGKATEFEDQYNADGVDDWFRVTVTPIPDGIAIATQIISERKLAEEALREKTKALKKAMNMKDEFLTTITHEFKTPLNVINAALQAIDNLYTDELSDNIKKHLDRIRINYYRQLRLVNNILDITRYNAGYMKVHKQNIDIVYLTRSITQSIMVYANQKQVKVHFSSDIEFIEMAMDDEKYERILLNLLSNAIKFTPRGKCIYVHLASENSKILISVQDEGIGIPKDKQLHIFERFGQVDSVLTRQAEGTGIGLSLVKALLSALSGTIELDSDVNRGSKFTIVLPITKIRKNAKNEGKFQPCDSRIMQTVEIEFSDIYIR